MGRGDAFTRSWTDLIPQRLDKDVKMWAHFRHQNILRILGVTAHKHMTSCMVTPWMPRGNAHQFVIDNPDVSPIRIVSSSLACPPCAEVDVV